MTVWILNGPMNLGGTESLIMELLRNKSDDVDVKMIIHAEKSKAQGVYDEEIQRLGIPKYELPSVGSVGLKAYAKAFKQLVNQIGKPDVIHSNMNAVGGMICKVAKECGIEQRIVHCHADIKYRGSLITRVKSEAGLCLMKKYVNKYANHFWACSEAAARRLFYNYQKAVIIPNVINVEKYLHDDEKRMVERQRIEATEDVIAVGAVGRIVPIKNYETIIDAISILKNRGTKAHFYCYGAAASTQYFGDLQEYISQKNVADRIHFLGNSTSINDRLNAFDVYVMPSISEGLGISALEAQAAGLPTLLSMGVPAETDMEIGNVQRVETLDAEAWANAIENSSMARIGEEKIVAAFNKKGFNARTKCAEIYQMYKDMVR